LSRRQVAAGLRGAEEVERNDRCPRLSPVTGPEELADGRELVVAIPQRVGARLELEVSGEKIAIACDVPTFPTPLEKIDDRTRSVRYRHRRSHGDGVRRNGEHDQDARQNELHGGPADSGGERG